METPATAAIFLLDKVSVYLPYRSERWRRPAEKWPRPFGLRPKIGQPALPGVHL